MKLPPNPCFKLRRITNSTSNTEYTIVCSTFVLTSPEWSSVSDAAQCPDSNYIEYFRHDSFLIQIKIYSPYVTISRDFEKKYQSERITIKYFLIPFFSISAYKSSTHGTEQRSRDQSKRPLSTGMLSAFFYCHSQLCIIFKKSFPKF